MRLQLIYYHKFFNITHSILSESVTRGEYYQEKYTPLTDTCNVINHAHIYIYIDLKYILEYCLHNFTKHS